GEEPIVPRPDPTAQQEPGAFNRFPGIENPTTSDYIGAAVADEQLKLVFALRDVRKERGLEIAEVAEAADVPASEISMFESGS
ncbi:helix-turn-helix domain-containing protein, partial [Enterococcus faecalis]